VRREFSLKRQREMRQRAFVRELGVRGAQYARQFDERTKFWQRRHRCIDRGRRRPSTENSEHVATQIGGDARLRFARRAGEVRSRKHARVAQEPPHWMFRRWRFFANHVDGSACDMLGIKRCEQRFLVYQSATRTVDDAHSALHRGEFARA